MREEYPLHWFVYHSDFAELQKALDLNVVSIGISKLPNN